MSEQLQKLIEKINAKPRGDGWYEALCPFHNDHHPSLQFNENGFVCQACGKRGTLDELESLVL